MTRALPRDCSGLMDTTTLGAAWAGRRRENHQQQQGRIKYGFTAVPATV